MNPMVKELTSTGYCLCFDETGMIKKEVYENSGFYNNTTYRFFGNGKIISTTKRALLRFFIFIKLGIKTLFGNSVFASN